MRPIHKVRTRNERFDPGGGGINVARAIRILGGTARALVVNSGNANAFTGRKGRETTAMTGDAAAKAVGALIAGKAVALSIEKVVFDRCGFIYHGRVKALADAAREAGLQF